MCSGWVSKNSATQEPIMNLAKMEMKSLIEASIGSCIRRRMTAFFRCSMRSSSFWNTRWDTDWRVSVHRVTDSLRMLQLCAVWTKNIVCFVCTSCWQLRTGMHLEHNSVCTHPYPPQEGINKQFVAMSTYRIASVTNIIWTSWVHAKRLDNREFEWFKLPNKHLCMARVDKL